MTTNTLYIISQHFYPSEGATAQLLTDIASELASDIKVIVLTSTPGDSSNRSDFKILRFSTTATIETRIKNKLLDGLLFTAKALWYLSQNAVPSKSHLLIASNPPFIGLIGTFLNFTNNLTYTFLFQDLFPRSAVLAGILPARGPMYLALRLLMRHAISNSSHTILLSQAMKHRAIKEYSLPHKYRVIQNWAVEKASPSTRHTNPLAISWNIQDQFIVFYSGNFGRLHDIVTILEAARICIDNPKILFLFVGGGAQYSLIKRYCDAFSLSNVQIRPYVSRDMLPFSLQLADLSIVSLKPGADDTVSPSKIYGLLASKKPILLISSSDTALSKELKAQQIGVHVDTGDSKSLAAHIQDLSQDYQTLLRLGQNAYSYYSANLGRNKSLDEYRQLLVNKD